MTAYRSWRTAGANWAFIEHQMVWMLSIERRHDRWHDQTDQACDSRARLPDGQTCDEHPPPAEQLERLRIAAEILHGQDVR
jgi:non-ribosomal peptide synthetase component F